MLSSDMRIPSGSFLLAEGRFHVQVACFNEISVAAVSFVKYDAGVGGFDRQIISAGREKTG